MDKILLPHAKNLSEEAKAEMQRLWDLRDKINSINEITIPTLAQYCAVDAKVKNLTQELAIAEGERLAEVIDQLGKLQKILINYQKLLHLDEKIVVKSKNKYADLLLK